MHLCQPCAWRSMYDAWNGMMHGAAWCTWRSMMIWVHAHNFLGVSAWGRCPSIMSTHQSNRHHPERQKPIYSPYIQLRSTCWVRGLRYQHTLWNHSSVLQKRLKKTTVSAVLNHLLWMSELGMDAQFHPVTIYMHVCMHMHSMAIMSDALNRTLSTAPVLFLPGGNQMPSG